MQSSAIFPLFFLPPASYFSALLEEEANFAFEKYENFPKQTYRNRATILSPNGLLDLIVPVIRGSRLSGETSNQHTKLKDVRICYDSNWQRLHWKSLESCYRSAAYFEYYEAEFEHFFTTKYTFLVDLNTELLSWLFSKLKIKADLNFTTEYHSADPNRDYRNYFHKNKRAEHYTPEPYFQVFDDRLGFQPDLSIVDVLFNQGPQANKYF